MTTVSAFRLRWKTSLLETEIIASDPERQAVYSTGSCWWSLWADDLMPYSVGGIPTDPLGAPLLQANLAKFLESARKNVEHYGRHGILAFSAAFHGNVVTADGRPTAFKSWDKYNDLLDDWAAKK